VVSMQPEKLEDLLAEARYFQKLGGLNVCALMIHCV
jgi:hypothetical protein